MMLFNRLKMKKKPKQSIYTVLLSGLILTGCQHMQKAPELNDAPPLTSSQHQQEFQITGKIGVRTPQQNGSAFYGWTQQGDHFAIDLTGAMGIGQTSIRGVPGNVTLTSSKTGTLQADTPEELLFKATQWEAPITYLVAWINAQPAQPNASIQHDEQMRLSSIKEGGWQATLSYKDAEKLPNKLILIDDAAQNRVTLTIQTRQ